MFVTLFFLLLGLCQDKKINSSILCAVLQIIYDANAYLKPLVN